MDNKELIAKIQKRIKEEVIWAGVEEWLKKVGRVS